MDSDDVVFIKSIEKNIVVVIDGYIKEYSHYDIDNYFKLLKVENDLISLNYR